jgi:hypothetical protein
MEHIEQTPVNNKIKNSTNKKTQKTRIEYT